VRVLKIVVAIAVAFFLLLLAAIYYTQRTLLYFPTHVYVSLAQAQANHAFREISITTGDGIALKAWYAPAGSQPFTIVFFHGNGESLYGAAQIAEPYITAGFGFLAVEYRGYSGLPGKPTESGLYNDARACIRNLIARGVEPHHMILYGHSLGTGVAIEIAREFPVGGVMLLAPYLSIPSLARIHYPFLPAKLLVLDRFENDRKIGVSMRRSSWSMAQRIS
jgi:alpha-beta hydrolase superfamily lysophospholipase